MGNVVSRQESRHQVGDGPSLPTVRPEEEGAQTSFPAEQVRQLLVSKDPRSTLPRPPGWDLHPQLRATPGESGTMAGGAQLTQASPKVQGPGPPASEPRDATPGEQGPGGRKRPCPVLRSLLLSPLHQARCPSHRPSEQERL